ncbi:MAG: signal peptidase I [Telmatospirillum sp.]|nr:signal peptidase I [Telmatospirillum sp.]
MSLPPIAKTQKPDTLVELVKTVVYAVLIALGIRTFFFEPFNIPSASMVPTLLVGDYLFVSKFSFGYSFASMPYSVKLFDGRIGGSEPERGDVVVFKLPRDGKTDYIKRIVGLPGDRIQVTRGVLLINGESAKLERVEDFVESDGGFVRRVPQFVETLPGGRQHRVLKIHNDGFYNNTPEFTVPAGHYFAMGDHRDNSQDSRDASAVGFVPFENLVGRAQILFFSTDGTANLFLPWTWVTAARYGRLLDRVR